MRVYGHLMEETKRETADKMDEALNPVATTVGYQAIRGEADLKRNVLKILVRPEGLEPPAYWFEASRSIQLSYGRAPSRFYREQTTRR
jgi:hypothetical protein